MDLIDTIGQYLTFKSQNWDEFLKDSKVYESNCVFTGKELENEPSVRNRRFVPTRGGWPLQNLRRCKSEGIAQLQDIPKEHWR